MATVLISGGTGLIGSALTKALLEKNYSVIVLSRTGGRPQTGNLSCAQWNIDQQTIDREAIGRADYIIHLAGADVAGKRWTPKRKQEIVDSRVKTAELLVKTLSENVNHVKALISISGIGWYGPDPAIPNPHPFTEDDPANADFLGTTCLLWEKSVDPVTALGKRLVKFRTGIVLSREGGVLKKYERPLRFGIAAILGNGRQMISWIHIEDLVDLFIAAIENDSMKGVYNAVAPYPVSNKELILQLARSKSRFFIPFHVPGFILKLLLGQMSVEALKSATASCNKLLETGFSHHYPEIAGFIRRPHAHRGNKGSLP